MAYFDVIQSLKTDPRIDDYVLMQSHGLLLTVVIFYLLFVTKIGRVLMTSREGYDLKKVLLGYNLLQVMINTKIFLLACDLLPNFSVFCSPVNYSTNDVALLTLKLHHYYTLSKYFDLLDTGFFVLRKKYQQISFLHVYHHTVILTVSWVTCRYIPGGHAFFLFLFNSFVHIVMYAFYFISCWRPDLVKVWWKKYVTVIQIVQHYLLFAIFLLPFLNPYCPYPKIASFIILFNLGVMIWLFSSFFKKSYEVRKK